MREHIYQYKSRLTCHTLLPSVYHPNLLFVQVALSALTSKSDVKVAKLVYNSSVALCDYYTPVSTFSVHLTFSWLRCYSCPALWAGHLTMSNVRFSNQMSHFWGDCGDINIKLTHLTVSKVGRRGVRGLITNPTPIPMPSSVTPTISLSD